MQKADYRKIKRKEKTKARGFEKRKAKYASVSSTDPMAETIL
jgi:hypothetical protein